MATAKSAIRPLTTADWINLPRIVAYGRIFLAVYAAVILLVIATSPQLIDPFGKSVGTDFVSFWSAGKLMLKGEPAAAYDYARHFEAQRQALAWQPGQNVPYVAFPYPPSFLLVVAGLALLPYGLALALWLASTLMAYLASVRAILPDRRALLLALAFPAVFVNLGHGQNGFLTCSLLGGGLLLLARRPVAAGVLFGLLAFKPQLGLLLPLALIIGREWRAFVAASLTAGTTIGVSLLLLGSATWVAFFDSTGKTRTLLLERGGIDWAKFQSAFASVRLLGGSIALGYGVQALVFVAAAGAVTWAWWQPARPEIKHGVLVLGSLLATPFVYDYDLVLLALPIAWLAAIGVREGFLSWEKFALALAWLLPLVSRVMAGALHLPLAPVILALLLILFLRRVPQSRRGV